MQEKNESFTYNYNALQQTEVQQIRDKYAPQAKREETKLEQLRRLDQSAVKPGTVTALIVGIVGTLIMGVGMCCTLVWADSMFIFGIIIGVVGIGGMIAAYPIYTAVTKKQREKLAPRILELSEELMK